MKKEKTETTEYFECDGCQYVFGRTAEEKVRGTKLEEMCAILTIPWGSGFEHFHFHVMRSRNDCFRYWAHNPSVMARSLEERGWDEDDIEEFMRMFLYRDRNNPGSPGVLPKDL